MNNQSSKYKFLAIPLLALYSWLIYQVAWVGDDAFITFRSMENFVHGYGPVFNVGERVQTFTHPLWFLVQSAANAILYLWKSNPLGDGQLYFLNIFISFALSILTVIVLAFQVARSTQGAILALGIGILSKAFLDYSTSGLENPLTHFILVLFIATYLTNNETGQRRIFMPALLAALGGLNRLDLLLFFAPALMVLFYQSSNKGKTFAVLFLGFLPLIAWELFSLFYYGAPFPNTAYAKINTHIPALEMIAHGIYYFQNSLRFDPITLLAILSATIIGLTHKRSEYKLLVAGVFLYLLYILYIGGDFMSGRFFSAPLLVSMAVLSAIEFKSMRSYSIILALTIIIGIAPIYTIPERHPSFGEDSRNFWVYLDKNLIADERKVYLRYGLLASLENNRAPISDYTGKKWIFNYNAPIIVKVLAGRLGKPAYNAGPNVHIVDVYSLADPLMARLPLYDIQSWRVGHYQHIIPNGYIETLETGENKIANINIATYYDKLAFVIKGDLWNWQRIKEIWNLNTGKYDYLLENITSAT